MSTQKRNEQLIQIRTGMENYNHQGLHMTIQTYYGVKKVDVVFDDGFVKTTDYKSFVRCSVQHDYAPTKNGIGIIGKKYSSTEHKKEYGAWSNMLNRCYSKKYKEEHPTYKNATCCKEWLLFENFYEWVIQQDNYEALKGTEWAPDKDILIKGNKLYSPNTVCLVPQNVNKLFLKHDNAHGDLPIGVTLDRRSKSNKYVARCNNPLGKNWSKHCATVEEAFLSYKRKKEEIIKMVAKTELEKGTITQKCYEAMMNYQVEITD